MLFVAVNVIWVHFASGCYKTREILVRQEQDILHRPALLSAEKYLIPPDVERAEGDVVGAGEVEELVVAGEGLEEVVGELEDGVGDDVVDDVLLVRVRVGVGHAHRVWGKREELGATEISKKAWLFAKLKPGRARKRIDAT